MRGGIIVGDEYGYDIKDYRSNTKRTCKRYASHPYVEGLPGFTQEEVANRLVPSMRGGITASASSSSTAPSYPLHVWRDYRRELGIVTPTVESPPCVEGLPGGSLLIVINQGIPSLCGGITEKVL